MRTMLFTLFVLFIGAPVVSAAPPCFGPDDFSTCPNYLGRGYHNTDVTLGETTIMHGSLPSGASWTMIMTPDGTVTFHHYPTQNGRGSDVIEVEHGGSNKQVHFTDDAGKAVDYDCGDDGCTERAWVRKR